MRQNIHYLLFLCCLCAHITVSIAQTKHSTDYPLYLQVDQSQNKVQSTDFEGWLKTKLQLSKEVALQPLGAEKDQLGFTHQRYQVTQSGIPIEGAVVISHSNQEKMLTAYNGSLFKVGNIQTKPNFTSKEALQKALNYVAAKTYRWENEVGVEPPTPQLVIAPKDLDFQIKDFRLCYKIDVYAIEPFERQWIYVDAQSGEIIATQNKLCTSHNHTATKHNCSTIKTSPASFPSIPNLPLADTEGTAVTKYSGTQTITTDQQNNRYLLQEQGRNIVTYNLYKTKNFNAATVFEDDDNYWDNVNENQDEIATDVHWATEQTYDYFLETHGRKSFDGQGITVRSYVHYLNPTFGTTFANAFWDGEHLVYGDGNGDNRGPLTSLDICAHEYTHAVTDYTANLINGRESGALNESFSDILSIAVENYAKPSTANFFLGEDVALDERGAIRNATDPKSFEDPDTYGGEYWSLNQTHNRSNVQTHWFYLLVNGGEGVNDLDQPYQVTGIGLEAATAIAYRNLTVYLTPPATYADARFFSIRAAMDLYGDCSFEAEQVVKAWYAVGLGESEELKVVANFAVNENQFCSEEANVDFSNHSIHANSYHWDFGDGSSSSEVHPTHDYQGFGNYTVQLIATSCDGEKDTIIQENLIQLDTESITCNSHNFDPSEQLNLTACKGVLYDNGGPLGDYVKNEEIRVTIEIEEADYITLDFKQFDASNSHELYIYDGNSQNAHRIGTYWGSRLPNDGETIVSTGNALHLRFNTYGGEERTFPGFEVEWKCHQTSQKPVVDFERPSPTSDTFECTGAGTLTDRTLYQPTEWFWDFGDGTMSQEPSPRHNYEKEGIFDVTLIACNAFGCDTLTKTAFIEVNKELAECQNLRVPLNGKKEINDCFGTVYDNGGASSNYSNNANGTLVIAPPNAERLGFTIERFTTEIKDDLLLIYDGTSVNAPLLLSESGKNAPQDTIWAESGALTLYFRSNDSTVSGGFEIDYFSVPTPISPTADFSWTPSNAPLGVPISFQNQSSKSNQWFWDFGDGNTSTLEKPVHVFKENGEYEVSLITQNCYAADSTDQIISIQSKPTLEVNPENIEVTLVAGENETQTVNLSNIGAGELYFGIQTNAFEVDTLIEKYYTDLGSEIYFFEDVRPFDKFRLEVTINGDFNDTAEFMWLQVEDEEYLSVGINSESAPNGTDILVSFPFDIDLEKAEKWLDDEQLKVKIGRGSNVGLDQGGKNYYQIRLVADHANWLQIPTKNGVIEANEQSSIQAKFDASDLWAGTYFNELRIVNNEAENSVKTIPCTLNVLPHPLADFKKVTGTSCDGKVEFKDKSINEPDSWLWDFGDGNTSTEENPTHQYTESAYYNVSLKACKGTACNEISKPILLAPIADFNVSSNIFPQNIPISFANLSQGGTGYAWDFGDGNTSTERNPQHSYEGAGTYEIQLITSNCFSTDTSTKIIQIEASPQALISTELLELTLQAGTQTLQNIPIQNIGAGTLEYEAMLQTVFEESTAIFDEAGDQTTHTFEGVVASDGLQLKITLNGDFDEAEERVWVRLDGEGMGYVLDKNVDSAEDQTYVMNLSPSIYQHLLADGTLKVELQNSNEVEVRSDRANTHSVELTAFGVPWLSLLDENETIEANQTDELRLEFDASEMNAGIYEFPLQIKTNESADFNYVIPTRLEVIGVGLMVFSANTIDFGEVRIGESGSQTLTFFNGGTDTLFVNEIKLDNPVFSIDVNELTLLPKMSHDATLTFSPTSMGDYEADLTVKSLFEDQQLNLLGNAVGAPKISVTPDSLWVALPIGEQTTKPLTVSNIGTYNLVFEAENATFTRFDSLATEDILQIADTTIHIFENLQMTDSLQLVFEMYGDYNESDEFVEVYLNGQWTATFGVENPDTSFLVRDSLAFSWMDLAEILEDGQLEVMLVNSEEVNTGFTLSERHDVRLKTFDNIWLNVAQEPALVPNNEAKIIDVLFDAQNLELGTYYQDIQVFADDPENAKVIVPTTLVVFENVEAAFEVDFEGVCDGRVQFQDLSSENTVEWHWDFGDETTSMEQNPAHEYELPGVYEVQLVAAHEFVSDTSYLEVTVDFTIADFEVPNLVFLDETIELFNTSLGAISTFWDFGDGNVSTMYQPAYEYDSIGTFTLQLVTESANGCVDTLQKEVLVLFEVGIEDWTILPDWLQIYPNPVAQLLKVVVNKTNLQGVEIQLFSSLGQLVRQLRFEGKEQEIDVQDLPSGVYYLDLQTADFRGVHKIVVE